MDKIEKLRCGEAIKFEFKLKELDMNQTGKSRCEEGNDVSQAQRSGPLLLVFFYKKQRSRLAGHASRGKFIIA